MKKNNFLNILKSTVSLVLIFVLSFSLVGCSSRSGQKGGLFTGLLQPSVYKECNSVSRFITNDKDIEAIREEVAVGFGTMLRAIGASDAFITGTIANMIRECGLDYRIPQRVGTDFPSKINFDASNPQIEPDNKFWRNYLDECFAAGGDQMGFGMFQFTDNKKQNGEWSARNATKLLDFGDEVGACWQTDLKLQLAECLRYMHGRMETNDLYISDEKEAAKKFVEYLAPGNKEDAINKSIEFLDEAREFTAKVPTNVQPIDLDSINFDDNKSLYAAVGGIASSGNRCNSNAGDYSTLVSTAVSLSYDENNPNLNGHEKKNFYEKSNSSSGDVPMTQQYYDAVNLLFGDGTFADCGRTIATIMRLSKADEEYVGIGTSQQLQHCVNSSKWEKVGSGTCKELFDGGLLTPGTVLINGGSGADGHTLLYVGNEAIKQQFPDAPDDYAVVHGSMAPSSRGPKVAPLEERDKVYEAFVYVG